MVNFHEGESERAEGVVAQRRPPDPGAQQLNRLTSHCIATACAEITVPQVQGSEKHTYIFRTHTKVTINNSGGKKSKQILPEQYVS